MTGHSAKGTRHWLRISAAACTAFLILSITSTREARAQGLTYVEGIDQSNVAQQNIFRADGQAMSSALDPFIDPNAAVPGNNLWNYRDEGAPEPFGIATIYESIQEDSPELRQRISGLTPAANYDIYIAYWSDQADWSIRAGFTSNANANTLFNRTGNNFGTAGTLAGSGAWIAPPLDNPESTDDPPSPFVNTTTLGGTVAAATQNMYLGFVGSTAANVSGQIDVFFDDVPSATDINVRTWFDGLAYVAAATPVFVTATLNRDTGNLTINNPTGSTFNIASYSVTSAAGSLIPAQWDSITTGGNATISETHPWTTSASTAVGLTEAEDPVNNGAQLVATTAAFNLGNLWERTPLQDVQITLNLTNGSALTVAPTYTEDAIVNGDFNGDGVINIGTQAVPGDFIILKNNFFANASALTLAQAYKIGDMSQDRLINSTDFVAFRTAYDQFNGVGAFEAAMQAVPEPAAGSLAAIGLAWLGLRRRRRQISRPSFHTVRKLSLPAMALGLAAVMATAAAAQTTVFPITGWVAVNNGNGNVVPITNGDTNSPTVGAAGVGDSADNATVWAALPNGGIDLATGQEIVLRGSVQLIGSDNTGDSLRWGVFDGFDFSGTYDRLLEPVVTNVPASRSTINANGWLGILASAAGNGTLEARNPECTEATQFISNAGGGDVYPVAGLGPPEQTWDHDNNPGTAQIAKNQTGFDVPGNNSRRVIRLSASPSTGAFTAKTYEYTLTVGRYGFENQISARLASTTNIPLPGDQEPDNDVDGADFLAIQRNYGGTATDATVGQFRTNFGRLGNNGPDYLLNLAATLSPSQDTAPTSMISTKVDRVAFLLSNGMNTDQAVFGNVELEVRQIQALQLNINTANGKVSISNPTSTPFDIIYYQITSPNGNLNPAGWTSLDDGEGGDPPGVGWEELGTPSANSLVEGNLEGSRLFSPAGAPTLLGTAFNTATTLGQRDTNLFYVTTDGVLRRGTISYTTTTPPIAAVPEPGAISLVVIAAAACCRRRKRV